jgi:hypothetical protein
MNKSREMLQMTLHLTRSSRLWTLLLLGLGVFLKNATLTVSMEIGTQRRDFRPLEDKVYLIAKIS